MTALDLFQSREAGPFGRRQKRARGVRIPVTIVTGFLGAGKTTLLRRFLATPEGQDTAVVINEYGAVGIDDALVRGTAEQVALLGNGCVCCTTRSDLQVALRHLVMERERGTVPPFDRVLIETSGLADPAPILQTFATDRALGGEFFIEVVVTAIDAVGGLKTLDWSVEARKQAILADRLVITKTDVAEEDAAERLHGDPSGAARRRPPAGEGLPQCRGLPRPGAGAVRAAPHPSAGRARGLARCQSRQPARVHLARHSGASSPRAV